MKNLSFWPTIEKLFQQGFAFLIFLFVARQIGPQDVGHISIIYIYIALTIACLNGASTFIVTQKVLTHLCIKSVFKINVILTAITILIYLISGYAFSYFKNDPSYEFIFINLCIFPILFLLYSIPNALLIKHMKFKALAIRTVVAMLVGALTVVILLKNGYGYYSLLYQQLAFYTAMAALTMFSCRGKEFDYREIENNEAVKLSGIMSRMNVTLSNVLYSEVPKFILYFIFPAQIYGLITVCYRVRHAATEVLVVGPLSYLLPKISKSGITNKLFTEIFDQKIKFLLPAILYIAFVAMLMFDIVLGYKWQGISNYIAISFFGVIIYTIYFIFFTIAKVHVIDSTLKKLNIFYIIWGCVCVLLLTSFNIFFVNAYYIIGIFELYYLISAYILYRIFKQHNLLEHFDFRLVYSLFYCLAIYVSLHIVMSLSSTFMAKVVVGHAIIATSVGGYFYLVHRYKTPTLVDDETA